MSKCISHYGEFGHHEPEVDSFTCARCGAEDWDEVMAHIARLSERLDLAITMHGVQLERANRVTAERDTQHAAAALLAETLALRTDEHDQMAGALADMTQTTHVTATDLDALRMDLDEACPHGTEGHGGHAEGACEVCDYAFVAAAIVDEWYEKVRSA